MLYPFLSFYGSKYRAAKRYPPPLFSTIIEPFAGGAGYSLNYESKKVFLVELDPRLAGIWRFLIAAKPDDILSLPLLDLDATINDLPPCDPNGRELIRSWLQGGARNGKNSFSSMAKNNFICNPNTPAFWGRACRARIANQVEKIKHWEIIEGDYTRAPKIEATWFIDPPYNNAAGRVYRYCSLNYHQLGDWVRARSGQIITCENAGADWLPFRPLYQTANNWNSDKGKRSIEVIWP